MTFSTPVRAAVVGELRQLEQLRGGTVPTVFVASLAADIGASTTTVFRWLREDRNGDDRWEAQPVTHIGELAEEHIVAIYAACGNLRKAKRALDAVDRDIAAMSYPTFRRRWNNLPPDVRVGATDGVKAATAHQLKVLYEPAARNDVWHIDQQELPIWTIPKGRHALVVKPWLTTVLDGSTRRVMSVILTMGRANTETTTVVLADAMRRRDLSEPGAWVGGVPTTVYSDNGGEFRSHQLRDALVELGIHHQRSHPYMSHLNGKVERVQRTMQVDLIADLPGYTGGPRTLSGRDLFGSEANHIGEEELWLRILNWVDHYNSVRPHAYLNGATPNRAWCDQDTPLVEPKMEAVRLAMLRKDRRYKVQKTGVFFDGQYYIDIELEIRGLIGRKVDVRHMPGDRSFIEVFVGNRWICTATPHSATTPEKRRHLIDRHRQKLTDVRRYVASAAEAREASAFGDGNGAVVVEVMTGPPAPELPDIDGDDAEGGVAGFDGDPFADVLPDLGL